MKKLFFASLLLLGMSGVAFSEDSVKLLPDLDYGGNIASRSTLSGDWGGTRSSLSRDGIQFSNSITAIGSSIVNGGVDGPILSRIVKDGKDQAAHASWDNVLQIDTGKLGLWPGGLLSIRGEGRVGEGVNGKAGAISPVDNDALFPLAEYGDSIYDLTEATYTQFLSSYVAVSGGILNTLYGDALDLAGSTRGTAQFMNLAFEINPVSLATVPYKTLGGGFLFFPTGNPRKLSVSTMVMNHEDSSGHNPFDRDAGTTYAAEVNHRYHMFDRPGKQILGYSYADDDFNDFEDPRVLVPGAGASDKNNSYAAYYSVEHFLFVDSETDKAIKGRGFFGRFGLSDGNPNPIEYSYSIGFGGNNPWSQNDTFGIGFYYLDMSEERTFDLLRIENEQGYELWYNFECTPWLHLTPDLQIVDQGIPGTDTAYVASLRAQVTL